MLAEANQLYIWACQWRRSPDLTFLLVDDFTRTVQRAQQRCAEEYQPEEVVLLRRAYDLYERYARAHAQRIICLDRRQMESEELVAVMRETILSRYHR